MTGQLLQNLSGEIGANDIGPFRSVQLGAGKAGSGQVGTPQVDPGQVGSAQADIQKAPDTNQGPLSIHSAMIHLRDQNGPVFPKPRATSAISAA